MAILRVKDLAGGALRVPPHLAFPHSNDVPSTLSKSTVTLRSRSRFRAIFAPSMSSSIRPAAGSYASPNGGRAEVAVAEHA